MRGQRDGRNHHLHLLVSTRLFEVEGSTSTRVSLLKDLDTLGPEGLRARRREIVDRFNAVPARARLPQRYTALTLNERGLDRRGRRISPPAARVRGAPRPLENLGAAAASLAAAAGRLASASTRLASAAAAHGQALVRGLQARAAAREPRADASARLDAAVAGAARALPEGIVTVQLARRRRALLRLRRTLAMHDHAGTLALSLDAWGDAERRLARVHLRLSKATAARADRLEAGTGRVRALAA